MVTVVNNIALYTRNMLRVGLWYSYHTHTHTHTHPILCEVVDVLTNFPVVIISKYMCISNHYFVYLKLHRYLLNKILKTLNVYKTKFSNYNGFI